MVLGGMTLVPLVGGWVKHDFGMTGLAWLCTAITVVSVLLTALFVPERRAA